MVVVVAAPAVDEVVTRIRRQLEAGDETGGRSGAGSEARTVDVARASRTDRTRPGSLRDRRPAGWFAPDRPTLIVSDLQWADDESLDDLVAAADVMPEGKSLVVVHSTRDPSRALAVVHQMARRRGAVIDIAPSDADEIAGLLGIEPDRASGVLTATEGQPDLVVALRDDGTLGIAITERLSVLDDATRWTAELIAFGATQQRLPAMSGLEPDELDHTMTDLAIEGIVHGGGMIPAVADAVRRSATAARRSRVIGAIVELDEPGSHDDLASVLLDLEDRSDAAGALYVEVAGSSADADPAAADRFLAAARRSGIDPAALAVIEARIGLSTGDVTRSLRALKAGSPGAATELVLASAFVSIGDFESAAIALARSSLAELCGWVAAGLGRMPGKEWSPTAAGSVGAAIEAWLADDADRAFDQLKRAAIRFAAEVEPDSWPATPQLIQAVIAAKFGDLAAAERAVEAAVDEQTTGLLHHRSHLLMLAWLAARRGRLDDATATLRLVAADQLTPQQRLWRAAVECAIAVRDPEAASVGSAVDSAIDAIDGVGTHLYDIEIVGDAAAAATRARGSAAPDLLAPFEALANQLDEHGRIAAELAWARLSAALASDDITAIAERAHTVTRHRSAGPFMAARREAADVLASAGSTAVNAARAELAARRLGESGATHEAARMCGVLAVLSTTEADTRRLLKESRTWRAQRTQLRTAASPDRGVIRLSDQEERVAQLVLDGHTHKQIGSTLFISAKTVEHHVAHIRTKLGAGSRAELLASVRSYLGESGWEAGIKPS